MDVSEKRELYSGFSDALARAVEMAGIPVLFGLFGRWLDTRFDTAPIFLVAFLVFAFVGLGVRSFYAYRTRMESLEANAPWSGRQ